MENNHIKKEKVSVLKQWRIFEVVWLIAFLLVELIIIYLRSNANSELRSVEAVLLYRVIRPGIGITTVLWLVLAAKGRVYSWIFGIINSILSTYIYYINNFDEQVLGHILYLIPLQIFGFFLWRRKLKEDSKVEIKIRKTTKQQGLRMLLITLAMILLWLIFYYFIYERYLKYLGVDFYDYYELRDIFGSKAELLGRTIKAIDETTKLLSLILMVLAFKEHWIYRIVNSVLSISTWIIYYGDDMKWLTPILVIECAYLINSNYGLINWKIGSKQIVKRDENTNLVTS